MQDEFNYQPLGGVEPGEEQTVELSPNMFGDWSKAPKDKKDLILGVKVTGLDDAKNDSLYKATFTQEDSDRMSEIEKLLN